MTYFNIFILVLIIVVNYFYSEDTKIQFNTQLDDKEEFAILNTYMDGFNRLRGFSGAVLIAKQGKAIFEKAVGWEDVEKNHLNKTNTRFNLGSGNKMFTAVAIAQLAEQGKLHYNDPIIKHLPNYPNTSFATKATIHHLLTHSAGLGDYLDSDYKNHWREVSDLKDILPFFVHDSILFEPGEKHQYSNSGYIVLGLIIEAVSGQNYFDYIRENIYKAAEMNRTDSYDRDGSAEDLAVAYSGRDSNWAVSTLGIKGTSAGGGYSNVEDMLRFHNALQNNSLIRPETRKFIQSGKVPFGSGSNGQYGYGFIIDQINGKQHIGHGGSAPGIYFQYRFFPESEYTVIMFSNSESGLPDVLFSKINELITNNSDQAVTPGFEKDIPEKLFPVRIVDKTRADNFTVINSAPADTLRYWKVIKSLLSALDNRNLKAFNALFAKKDMVRVASNQSVFNFMVNQVYPVRGTAKRFHALSEPLKIADSDFPLRIATFHLEDGCPGYMGFSLNDEGLIDHFSLFIHQQLCPNGEDMNCNKISVYIE